MRPHKLLSLHNKYTAFTTLCASILHLSGFGAIFYLIPLEWYSRQRGLHRYWTITASSLTIIIIARLMQGRSLSFTLLEAYIILVMAFGLYVLHRPLRLYINQRRALIRFSIVALVFGVTAYPFLYLLLENAQWLSTIEQSIVDLLATQFATSISAVEIEVADIVQQITTIILSSYLFVYVVSVIGIWMIGELLSNSTLLKRHRASPVIKKYEIAAFTLPRISIWILIEIMSMFLLTNILVTWLHPLIANLLLVAIIFYVLQGVSIVYCLAMKHMTLPNTHRVALLLLFASIIVPGINLLSVITLLILGISETWVTYPARKHQLN